MATNRMKTNTACEREADRNRQLLAEARRQALRELDEERYRQLVEREKSRLRDIAAKKRWWHHLFWWRYFIPSSTQSKP